MKYLKVNVLFVCCLLLFWNGSIPEKHLAENPQAEETEAVPTYTFAIVPQFHSQSLFRIWNPILKQLSKETGIKFKLTGNSSFLGFEKELRAGKYHFAYVNPYHAVMAHNAQKYNAILSDSDRKVQGILVVKKTASEKVAKLQNKKVAFPSPNTLASSILLRSELENKFKIKVKPKYLKTHTDVYMNVYQGTYDAGGGVYRTFEKLSPKIKNSLKVVHKTEKIPSHPIIVHPKVPKDVQQKVIKAFIKMRKNPKTNEMLKKIPIKSMSKTSQSIYKNIMFNSREG